MTGPTPSTAASDRSPGKTGSGASALTVRRTIVVRVDITRGAAATPVSSDVANGTTVRNALLKAADIAVQKTNGMNLRGFFTARLAFIAQRTGKSEIYASDLFLRDAQQLTRDGAPALSPDGRRIAFLRVSIADYTTDHLVGDVSDTFNGRDNAAGCARYRLKNAGVCDAATLASYLADTRAILFSSLYQPQTVKAWSNVWCVPSQTNLLA